MSGYNFTLQAVVGRYETKVDPKELHGYFEHVEEGGGGELLFFTEDGKLHLEDYDGVFELPRDVIAALRDFGIIVDEDFE